MSYMPSDMMTARVAASKAGEGASESGIGMGEGGGEGVRDGVGDRDAESGQASDAGSGGCRNIDVSICAEQLWPMR